MVRPAIVLALIGCGCGGKKATCVEGASVACACPGGGSGAQTCTKDGTYGTCACGSGGAPVTSSGSASPKANACTVDALGCDKFAAGGATGWKLHKKVYEARNSKRPEEAICLARANLDASDKVLAGAASFETAHAWEMLGCKPQAQTSVDASLAVRPKGKSGWKETCAYCKSLGGACEPCKTAAAATCPDPKALRTLLAKAWKTDASALEESIACAGGKFPEPGYVVAVVVDTKSSDPAHYLWRLGVVTADGVAVAKQDGEALRDRSLSADEIDAVAANDFDGDGTDEAVITSSFAYKYSPSYSAVEVYAVKGGKLERTLHRGFSYVTKESEDEKTGDFIEGTPLCEGKYEIDDKHALVITGKILEPLAKHPDDKAECIDGTERYVGKAGKLVKQ